MRLPKKIALLSSSSVRVMVSDSPVVVLTLVTTTVSVAPRLMPRQASVTPVSFTREERFVTVDSIETLTRLDFHPNLVDDIEDKIEKNK